MKGVFFFCIVLLSSFNSKGFILPENDSCITESLKLAITPYFKILVDCDSISSDTETSERICDTSNYDLYLLSKDGPSELLLLKAKMAVTGGKVGDDFYILKRINDGVEYLNAFTGYLDCIKLSKKHPDIIFYVLTDHGRIKVLLSRKGKYYHRKQILDVEGSDVTKKNKEALLRKYNSENESHEMRILKE